MPKDFATGTELTIRLFLLSQALAIALLFMQQRNWANRISQGIEAILFLGLLGLAVFWSAAESSAFGKVVGQIALNPIAWFSFYLISFVVLHYVSVNRPQIQVSFAGRTKSGQRLDDKTDLIVVENETISRQTVPLDGHHYKNCTLDHVTYQFDGGPFAITDCHSSNHNFKSNDEAIKAFQRALAIVGRAHGGTWTFTIGE
jgi:hypothetical protein